MGEMKRSRCGELPDDVTAYLLSKLVKAKYVAIASCVCKSWYSASRLVTSLAFDLSIEEQETYRPTKMVTERVASLENIAVNFWHQIGILLCVGVISKCLKLTTLKLSLMSGCTVPLEQVFQDLSTLSTLTDFSFHYEPLCWGAARGLSLGGGVRFGALRVLRILNVQVNFSEEFTSAFPALEELEYRNTLHCEPYEAGIVSNTLKKLTFAEWHEAFRRLRVKAPKLSSLRVESARMVICESPATGACLIFTSVSEISCDASQVACVEVNGLRVEAVNFPKLVRLETLKLAFRIGTVNFPELVSVKTLATESRCGPAMFPKLVSVESLCFGGRILDCQCPLLRCVESCVESAYFLSLEDYEKAKLELWSLLSNFQQTKYLSFKSKIRGRFPVPLQLTELKRLRIVFDKDFLLFLVESSPALEILDIQLKRKDEAEYETSFTCHLLLELQRRYPKLIINKHFGRF